MLTTLQLKLNYFLKARTREERIGIFSGVFFMTFVLWYTCLFSPLLHVYSRLSNNYLMIESKMIESELSQNPTTPLMLEYQNLKNQNADLDKKLAVYLSEKQDHIQLLALLRSLLSEEGQLQLIALTSSTPATNLVNEEHHRVSQEKNTLIFSGTYFDILAYFAKLKNIQWHWHIDSLAYEVTNYPQAQVTLQLSTLVKA